MEGEFIPNCNSQLTFFETDTSDKLVLILVDGVNQSMQIDQSIQQTNFQTNKFSKWLGYRQTDV